MSAIKYVHSHKTYIYSLTNNPFSKSTFHSAAFYMRKWWRTLVADEFIWNADSLWFCPKRNSNTIRSACTMRFSIFYLRKRFSRVFVYLCVCVRDNLNSYILVYISTLRYTWKIKRKLVKLKEKRRKGRLTGRIRTQKSIASCTYKHIHNNVYAYICIHTAIIIVVYITSICYKNVHIFVCSPAGATYRHFVYVHVEETPWKMYTLSASDKSAYRKLEFRIWRADASKDHAV